LGLISLKHRPSNRSTCDNFTDFLLRKPKVSDTGNEGEKKIHLNNFLKVFTEYFFKIPSTDNYLDVLIRQISDPFERVVDTPTAHLTRYAHYRDSLFNIIERLGRCGKYSAFKNYINTVPYEDAIILA
jgi:hypothetical protein